MLGAGLQRPRLRMLCRVQTQIVGSTRSTKGATTSWACGSGGGRRDPPGRSRGVRRIQVREARNIVGNDLCPRRCDRARRPRAGMGHPSEAGGPRPLSGLRVGTVLLGVAAVWWTWAFAMPAAMRWDASATPRALAALRGIGDDKSVCRNVMTGAIGPLRAPFRQCAINGPPGRWSNTLCCRATRSSRPTGASSTATCPRPRSATNAHGISSEPGTPSPTIHPVSIGYTCHGGG